MTDQFRIHRWLVNGGAVLALAVVLAACGSAATPRATSPASPTSSSSSHHRHAVAIAPLSKPKAGAPMATTSTTTTTSTTPTGPIDLPSSSMATSTSSTSSTVGAAPVPTSGPITTPATTPPAAVPPTTPASTTATTVPPGSVLIKAGQTHLGTVLVNSAGRTLYMLTADKPGFSNCTSVICNTVWPAVKASGGAVAGPGVQQSLLGTLRLPDGTVQVTYAGWPLYTYLGDKQAGDAAGEKISSFGGIWYALVAATGQVIT